MHNEKTSDLLSAEIRAYKMSSVSRWYCSSLGKAVNGYLHDELKISTHELLPAMGRKMGDNPHDFMKLMQS